MSESDEGLTFRVERQEEQAVLRLAGDIDVNTSPELKEVGARLVEEGVTRIGLDLGGVSFLDSTGLGSLVVILKRLRDRGGKFCLFAANEPVRNLLALTGLDAVFHLEPDEGSALAYLRS